MNTLATEINGEVHRQDDKLDAVNKELDVNLNTVREGNKELKKAVKMSKSSTKCMCITAIGVIIALAFMAVIMAVILGLV